MSTSNVIADEGDTICPAWWPHPLWDLHYPRTPFNPGGPINLPAAVNQILLGLQTHTTSYHLKDATAAREMRKLALQQIQAAVKQLGEA